MKRITGFYTLASGGDNQDINWPEIPATQRTFFENGSTIINSAISADHMVDNLIIQLLFPKDAPAAAPIEAYILRPGRLAFLTKLDILGDLLKERRLNKAQSGLMKDLRTLNTYRNWYAHGYAVHEKGRLYIQYKSKMHEMNDDFWSDVDRLLRRVVRKADSLLGALRDQDQ